MDDWRLYIAEARTGRFYTGISKDPKRRVKKHNSCLGARFAVLQGPLKLIYVSNTFVNKSEARKREIQIKNWSRMKKLKLVSGEWK